MPDTGDTVTANENTPEGDPPTETDENKSSPGANETNDAEQTKSDDDKPGTKRTIETLLRVVVVGTVVIPLLVAIVAFGGGALGAWVTSRTNTQTIAAEREQAIEQFRRDQQKEQYAAILQQATRLENAGSFSTAAVGALSLPLAGPGS